MKATNVLVILALSMSAMASFALPAHAVVAEVVNQGVGEMRTAFNARANQIFNMPPGPARDQAILDFITELASIQNADPGIRRELAQMVEIMGGRLSNAAEVEQFVASLAQSIRNGDTVTATASLGNFGRQQASPN